MGMRVGSFISNIFSFLATAPDTPCIVDEPEIRAKYRYWRTRILYTAMIGYVGFYFVRKSLSVAMPAIEAEFDISKSQLGMILTAFGVTYGFSKFFNGFAADRSNPRYFMALGLFVSAVMNVLFGFSSGIIAFGFFWILNGWFQGMGWAPCSRALVNWFSATERGVKYAICNTAATVGAASVVFLNGYLVVAYGWRSCFFVPAGIAFVIVLFILHQMRDRPQSLGLPPVEHYMGEEPDVADSINTSGVTYQQMVMKYIFANPKMWILCFADFFVYVIRYTILDWGPTFLSQEKGLNLRYAAGIVGGYEVAGIAGILVGGFAMDKLFKGHGARTCAIYMAFCTIFVFAFWKLPLNSILGNGLLLWCIGFLIYGPQCLIGVAAANMVPKDTGAAAVGFTGLFGYLSTILSGWGLGYIVEKFEWTGGFFMLVITSVIATLLLGSLWWTNPYVARSEPSHSSD